MCLHNSSCGCIGVGDSVGGQHSFTEMLQPSHNLHLVAKLSAQLCTCMLLISVP